MFILVKFVEKLENLKEIIFKLLGERVIFLKFLVRKKLPFKVQPIKLEQTYKSFFICFKKTLWVRIFAAIAFEISIEASWYA